MTIHAEGPKSQKKKAVEALRQLGFLDVEESIPWREAFPELTDENLPGTCLAGMRYREGLSQRALAERTGIPQRHISEMENGKRPIGKKLAKRFAEALNVENYAVFL